MKFFYGLAVAIAFYLFAEFGKDVAKPLGVRLTGLVSALFCVAGFLVFLLFPGREMEKTLEDIRSKEAK